MHDTDIFSAVVLYNLNFRCWCCDVYEWYKYITHYNFMTRWSVVEKVEINCNALKIIHSELFALYIF